MAPAAPKTFTLTKLFPTMDVLTESLPLSPLFSREPVAQPLNAPVVVIGLPRSGSSFLSHVLSCLDDLYVFDDFYLLQRAQDINAAGELSPKQLDRLLHFLGWTVKARIKHEKNFVKPDCTWEDVDQMVEAMRATFAGRSIYWHTLLEEWLTRLALHHGRSQWGYKTPQDFIHMDMLAQLFPGIRFIFIMRHPVKMMSSIKFVHPQDGNPAQYHPVAYALYWKMAYRKVQSFMASQKAPVHVVKFEDLVKAPDQEAEKLAKFLGVSLSGEVPVRGSNTSFASGQRRGITPTETRLCELLAGDAAKQAGYSFENGQLRLQDALDLVKTTWRFAVYQVGRFCKRYGGRSSIMAYCKNLV
ncbi:MAG: sulfotransferase [Synechococcales bacterium]|nr:sulfotransferase [Synechococcales bacterium]